MATKRNNLLASKKNKSISSYLQFAGNKNITKSKDINFTRHAPQFLMQMSTLNTFIVALNSNLLERTTQILAVLPSTSYSVTVLIP